MSTAEMTVPPVQAQEDQRVHGPRLAGAWQTVGKAVWAALWLVSLGAFLLAVYVWAVWDSTPIAEYALTRPSVTQETITLQTGFQDEINKLGMSLAFYGGLFAVLRLVSGIPYFVLSVLIMRRRSDRLMAVLFAIALAVIGAAGRWAQPNWISLSTDYPWTKVPLMLLGFVLDCGVILLFTFPDGRFVPRWTRWVALAVLLISFSMNILANTPLDINQLDSPVGLLATRTFALIGFASIAYRFRYDANPAQKQQIKWIVTASLLMGLIYFIHFLIYDTPLMLVLLPEWTIRATLITNMILEPIWYVGQGLLAVCIGISVFRYRLWDIDTVINRVLVYGSLTILTMAAYLGVVALLRMPFRGAGDPLLSFFATGLIAIIFEPLRLRLQRLVNRLMYGARDDPYTVLTQLSNKLQQSATPVEMLRAIAATLGQALKIPYVAILVNENNEDHIVTMHGSYQPDYLVYPLVYQAEIAGSLRVARRAPGEAFSSADLRLMENIARQAGAAAQAVRLNSALVRSRAEIVGAREEERRRLRRDLHDGLGPILASQTLKMAAVRHLVRQNPERAETIVDDVINQNENTVSEVRRLVYGLRPPALDELGLIEAVRDLVRRGGEDDLRAGGLEIEVSGPQEGLPRLPAAVEVNAYRIALEALANVARHAQARRCTIRFRCEDQQENGMKKTALLVQIQDDGVGIAGNHRAGVGIRSMRERAEELGGRLSITPGSPAGTQVAAWLPLADWG